MIDRQLGQAKKRTSSGAAKKGQPVHLVPLCGTSLRSLLNADASESRVAPPSRFSAFSCAAWLREMAKTISPKFFVIIRKRNTIIVVFLLVNPDN